MPRRVYAYARTVMGRRGAMLALIGAAWVANGLTVPLRAEPEHIVLLNIADPLRAGVWIGTGLLAIAMSRRREDRAGWLALYVMAAYRAVAYSAGAVALLLGANIVADGPALAEATSRAVTWAAVIVAIRVCSGWREHPDDLNTGAVDVTAAREGGEGAA